LFFVIHFAQLSAKQFILNSEIIISFLMRYCNFYVIITAVQTSDEAHLNLDKMLVRKNFLWKE
jgi:hypothetical protein